MDDTTKGVVAVVGAIFFFGSTSLPVKFPAVQKAKVDPVIYQCYYSFSIFCCTWLVLFLQPFSFSWWGISGAFLWMPSSAIGVVAINMIGMATAQGVWSGVAIVCSFCWGAFVFQEEITSWGWSIVGLLLLITGIVGVSICNMQWEMRFPAPLQVLYALPWFMRPGEKEEESVKIPLTALGIAEPSEPIKTVADLEEVLSTPIPYPPPLPVEPDEKSFKIGMVCATLAGLMIGTMMVPTQFVPKELEGIAYSFSFGIGVMMATIIVTFFYLLFRKVRGYPMPKLHLKVALGPGILAGVLWICGNICSIYATIYLGLTVGYPLTQTALLLAGVWGMLLFREITRIYAIFTFCLSALIILGGAGFLVLFG